MSAASQRKELRQRRKAFKAASAARRREVRQRLEALPAFQKRARQRRLRRVIMTLLILILILACCHRCGPGKPAEPRVTPTATLTEPKPPLVKAPPHPSRPPLTAPKIDATHRAQYQLDESAGPTWLDLFRLQVSSRSPKLAACFDGAERPGALRWSAALTPESGMVSDQGFERLGPGDDVSSAQRECLTRVLATPPYRLAPHSADGGALPTTPTRVGIVLEF